MHRSDGVVQVVECLVAENDVKALIRGDQLLDIALKDLHPARQFPSANLGSLDHFRIDVEGDDATRIKGLL